MNLLDSSAWIEFFQDGPNAETFAAIAADKGNLLVPTIVLYEVFKFVLRVKGEVDAGKVAAALGQGRSVAIDEVLALSAAKLALRHRLAMADSLIYATALAYDATLWTQDDDFAAIPGVRYLPKPRL
ncbi:MAG: type II toxin-antitoxin system VapC family toxin [Methylococcus sp.]